MNIRLVLCLAFCSALLNQADASCGAQLTSSVNVDISSPNIIKKLWINSLYSYTVNQGDAMSVKFIGTDDGQAVWTTSAAEVSMTITTNGLVGPAAPIAKTPSKEVISSGHQYSAGSFVQLAAGLVGAVLILLVAFSYGAIVETADGDPLCQNVAVEITIPSGKVWMICDSNNGTCVCGPDYSGPNCNFYKSTCQPTAQQMANRFNFPDPMPPAEIPLPDPGQSWCDSNFGSQIWRVSNREPMTGDAQIYWAGPPEKNSDQRVHIVGGVGFSPDLKYVISQTYSSAFAYEIAIDEYNIPHIDPKKRILLSLAYDDKGLYPFIIVDVGRGAWMSNTHFVFVYYDQVFSMDITKPFNDRGGMDVVHIGNLTQFLINNYYAGPLNDINRCSNSRRFADGSIRMLCDIGYSVGTLQQPDYTMIDSHSPNATCIAAQWIKDASTGRIGYIAFDILSPTPTDPQSNIRVHSKFVNGVDSDEWFCFQSARQWSSALQDYRTWVIYNGQNNGYKMLMDRSGQWTSSAAIDKPQDNGHSVGFVPTMKFKWRPFSEGGGIAYSVVHDYEGHGGFGWGQAMMQSGAPGDCQGWCIAYFNFSAIPDDDPGVYNPTAAIGPNFDDGPWIYQHGLYGTYFHATPTNQGEAVMAPGCDASKFNCSEIPRGSEVLRVIPDKQGGGTIERIASTRDGSHTQYAIITNECEDDDGPCWALFQSTWGGPRPDPESYYTSDVFIVRFR